MTDFLNKIKAVVVPRLKREGRTFRLLKAVYLSLQKFIGYRRERLLGKVRRIVKKTPAISSCIVNSENCVVEFGDGKKFFWNPADVSNLLNSIINSGGNYELAETELFSRVIKSGDTIMDIGASFGWHTVRFLELVGPKGKVYAFEPEQNAYGELVKNIGLNFPGVSNVFPEKLALTDKNGKEFLYVPKQLGSAFATLIEDYNADYDKSARLTVETENLDDYVAKRKLGDIDFVKCDIEGAELSAMAGAEKLMQKKQAPMVFVEVNDRNKREIFDEMEKSGYRPYYFSAGRLIKLEPFQNNLRRLPYFNFLFIKPAHLPRVKSLI